MQKIKDVPRYQFLPIEHSIISSNYQRVPYLRFYIKENGEKTKFEDTKVINKFAIKILDGDYENKYFVYTYFCIDKDENKLELDCKFLDPRLATRDYRNGIDEKFYKVAAAIMFDMIGKQEDLLELKSESDKKK